MFVLYLFIYLFDSYCIYKESLYTITAAEFITFCKMHDLHTVCPYQAQRSGGWWGWIKGGINVHRTVQWKLASGVFSNQTCSLRWAFVDSLPYLLKYCGLRFKREGFLELDSDPILSRVKASTLKLFGCKSISLHLSKALVLIAIWIPCCMRGMNKWAETWSSAE